MRLSEQVDAYCERTDFSFWSEPVNALSNAGFLIAAAWMWQRCLRVRSAQVLCAILFVIGIGSFLFHTYATAWASLADVIPIGGFILTYLFLVNRNILGLPLWAAGLGTALFVPYAAALVPVLDRLPFFQISNFYWTVPILIFAYALGLRRRAPHTARGMAIGAAVLCLSIAIRSLDEELCSHWPVGTHFLWHLSNALMLGWMIEVYRRHMLAGPSAER